MGRYRDGDSFDRDLKRNNERQSGRPLPEPESPAERNREKGRWEHSPSDVTDTPQSDRPSQRYSNDLSDQQMGYTDPGIADSVSTALEHKQELAWLKNWDDADLYKLRLYREPTLLEGQMYFDLRDPDDGEFRAGADRRLRSDELLVAKNELPEELWDRLTGYRDEPEVPAA